MVGATNAAMRAVMTVVRECADTMDAQAKGLREALAAVPMGAPLRTKAVDLCAGLTDTAGRVTFELALMASEWSGDQSERAGVVQHLVGLEAAMMDALAQLTELADELESAAERDEQNERAFVLVIEATGVMLQGLEKARAAADALVRA